MQGSEATARAGGQVGRAGGLAGARADGVVEWRWQIWCGNSKVFVPCRRIWPFARSETKLQTEPVANRLQMVTITLEKTILALLADQRW